MRLGSLTSLLLLVGIAVWGQQPAGPGQPGPVQSIFDSGLASSLLQADTPPVSISQVRTSEGYGDVFNFSSGSWLQIKGTSLAFTSPSRTWLASDFNGVNAPTSLDGVRVTINGRPGFVYFTKPDDANGPSQINVQAPDDPAVGPVEVRVTNPFGSTTFVAQKVALAPGMLAPGPALSPFFSANGKQYLVATFGLQNLYVGNPDLFGGVPFLKPAKPHDTIFLYGIGFGDVDPALPAGTIATVGDQIRAQFSIRFGSTPANVSYAGHYPTFVGLYFFVVEVPDVPDGDQQVHVVVNGQELPQTVYLTIKR